MRVEYINPFVTSAVDVLSELLHGDVTRGELSLKESSQPVLGVAVIVALTGQVEGRLVMAMDEPTSLAVAAALNGQELEQMDELTRATVTEVANMIAGRATTALADLGYQFDISPPVLLTGDNMTVAADSLEALVVPIDIGIGRLELNVALRDRVPEAR